MLASPLAGLLGCSSATMSKLLRRIPRPRHGRELRLEANRYLASSTLAFQKIPYQIMSCHFTLRHLCHVMSRRVTSCLVMSHQSNHILIWHAISYILNSFHSIKRSATEIFDRYNSLKISVAFRIKTRPSPMISR